MSASGERIFWTCMVVWMLVCAGLEISEHSSTWWVLLDVACAGASAYWAEEAKGPQQ